MRANSVEIVETYATAAAFDRYDRILASSALSLSTACGAVVVCTISQRRHPLSL